MFGRILPVVTAVTALVACGVVHGLWTERWRPETDPALVAARFAGLPQAVGEWQGEDLPVSAREVQGLSGFLSRRYVNRQSGEAVTVVLTAGRPGLVAIHTPDVCYAASGYDVDAPAKYAPADLPAPAEFWTTEMVRTRPSFETRLRIFYAWNAGGGWAAADNPRLAFAGAPVLYKLYLIREAASANTPLADDPCLQLLRRLQPELQKSLFPSDAPPADRAS
jgi:hypothetical protein